MRVLLTTTSYQDTPGEHHDLLQSMIAQGEGKGWEVEYLRGPLSEAVMLEQAGQFDAFLCGDDAITRAVIEKSLPKLKVISKYGIGLDKIDCVAASEHQLPVLFTPGVNHTTVAEHTILLLLALSKNFLHGANAAKEGQWSRLTGTELWKKKMGLVGVGRIGQETAKRAAAFDMELHGFGNYWAEDYFTEHNLKVTRHDSLESLSSAVDILSLHSKLTEQTRQCINAERLALLPDDALLINTSRGEMIDNGAVIAALDSGKLAGYAADVLDLEPPPSDHPLLTHPKTIITPHVASRTAESVPRQALRATHNLINYLSGEGEVHQANTF